MKKEVLAGLPESSLEIIDVEQFSTSIDWKEEGKEFALNGVMYDVVKTTTLNGRLLIYCLNDQKEKQLINSLVKAIHSGQTNTNGKSGKQSVKFQLPVYVIPDNLSDLFTTDLQKPLQNRTAMQFSSSVQELIDPPPQI